MQKREQQCFVLWLYYFTYAAAKLGSLNNSGPNGICVVLVQCTRTVLAMVSLIKGHSNLIKTHCICHSSYSLHHNNSNIVLQLLLCSGILK